jgi:hypothetical protein
LQKNRPLVQGRADSKEQARQQNSSGSVQGQRGALEPAARFHEQWQNICRALQTLHVFSKTEDTAFT